MAKFPLKYCKISRAAKYLNCDVTDIVHFGAIRAVKLFLNFESKAGNVVVTDRLFINEFDSYCELDDEDQINNETNIWNGLFGKYSSFHSVLPISKAEKSDVSDCLYYPGWFDGFWLLPSTVMKRIEINGGYTFHDYDEDSEPIYYDFYPCIDKVDDIKKVSILFGDETTIGSDDLWIFADDVDALKATIDKKECVNERYNIKSQLVLSKNADDFDAKSNNKKSNTQWVDARPCGLIKLLILSNSRLISHINDVDTLLKEINNLAKNKNVESPVKLSKTLKSWLDKGTLTNASDGK